MNLVLNYEGFEKYLLSREEVYNGIQYRFKFDNLFGASVIKHTGSYGHEEDLWELAVLNYRYENNKGFIDYDTNITDDVIGNLNDEQVRELLIKIKELPLQ